MEKEFQELVNGFAQLYLEKKGYTPEESVDEKGDLKPDLVKELEWAMQQTDEPFWNEFIKDPNTTMDKFLENQGEYSADTENETPEESDETVMAKKGAKLKKLQDFKNKPKSRKCSCGCDMIMKKEKGGKMVEVCACGCKGSKTKKHRIGGTVTDKKPSSKILAELKNSKKEDTTKKKPN